VLYRKPLSTLIEESGIARLPSDVLSTWFFAAATTDSFQYSNSPLQVSTHNAGSAQAAAEAAARERDERTPTAPPKRLREWEDDSPMNQKPPTNDEKRQRLDEPHSRRTSPPHRIPSPPRHSPHDNMDARRLNDSYHPSDAAHHPPSLPSINATQPMPRISETPKQERPEHHEPAARQMDVDEDYSDGAEDEKRNGPLKSERESPRIIPTNGLPHAPTPVEQKS
jgi:glucose repression mediator protein